MTEHEFEAFPKLARLSREIVVSEKIDGTNAQIHVLEDGTVLAGSRTRYIKVGDDNFGFAGWVKENEDALRELGPGRHFGEWWGKGIQRGYGLQERRFSLFNVHRWGEARPLCCRVVPTLYKGEFSLDAVEEVLGLLKDLGSKASPGFRNPEGIVVFHTAANQMFKKTIDKDEVPKSMLKAA